MAVWNMDVNRMREFLPFLVGQCNTMSNLQEQIDAAYNRVQDSWRDRMCLATGQQLKITGTSMGQFHEFMTDAINQLLQKCNHRAVNYLEMQEISLPGINPFEINVLENESMNNENMNTDSSALRNFDEALNGYIDGIVKAVNDICGEYDNMQSSWNDALYRRFGDVLEDFKRSMQTQVNNLNEIDQFVRYKISMMEQEDE